MDRVTSRWRTPRFPHPDCLPTRHRTIIDLFLGLVLGPIIGRMSVPARVEFTTRLMPKMVLIMPTVVTLTLAAGWQLSTELGTNLSRHPDHGQVVASMIVVGVFAVHVPVLIGFTVARFYEPDVAAGSGIGGIETEPVSQG